MWAKKWLLGRDRFTHLNLLNFIRNGSPEDYKNYLRMSDENIQYSIAKVKPLIGNKIQNSHCLCWWSCGYASLAWDLPHTYEPIASRRRAEPDQRP